MRTLATIQKIRNVIKHENADALEIAKVLGWSVVVKKNEFQVGNWCVYCEIDSVFPNKPEFLFLANKHFRIKTIKLRGAISQGICFPLSILPEAFLENHEIAEGLDVTNVLGVTKYEPAIPAQLTGLIKGHFPSFLQKTDETRIQNLQPLIEAMLLNHSELYFAEKIDGTSMTVYNHEEFGVASRNMDMKETEGNSYWKMANNLDLKNKLPKGFCVQGELAGPGIQKNKYHFDKLRFFVFNVINIQTGAYLNMKDMINFCKDCGLDHVPIIHLGYLHDFGSNYDEILENLIQFSQKTSFFHTNVIEGIVIRTVLNEELYKNERISFKVINPQFLLKFDDA